MKAEQTEYKVVVNGTPDYSKIPKAMLEPIVRKFLENILKEANAQKDG